MELKNMKEQGAAHYEELDAIQELVARREVAARAAAEVISDIYAKERKFTHFAEKMLSLTSQLRVSSCEGVPSTDKSPLIKVESTEQGDYYIAVKKIYDPTGYDGEGAPTGSEMNGHSFNAYVGVEMEPHKYKDLPYGEQTKTPLLGYDLRGRSIYGKELNNEKFGRNQNKNELIGAGGAALAKHRESSVELLARLSDTVRLVQAGLADEKLNPVPQHINVSNLQQPI